MRGKAAIEVLREPQHIADRGAGVDLFEKVARQLANLHPLQTQLPLGIPASERGSPDCGQDRVLLGAGPSHEIAVKVVQRETVGLEIPAIERKPEVIEP